MYIVFITLGRPARWLLSENDPVSVTLRSLPDWLAVNPLVYNSLLPWRDPVHDTRTKVLGLINGDVLVETAVVCFVVNDLEVLSGRAPTHESDRLSFFLEQLLPVIAKNFVRRLRFVTKQAELPFDPSYGLASGPDKIPEMKFPSALDRGGAYVLSYQLETAITWERLSAADQIDESEDLPVHDSLLLDAILALLEGDHRRAILFAAIAMETYSAATLERVYTQLVESKSPSRSHRIVSFPQPGDAVVTKDPIYSYIAERSRNEFAPLLHELPLYLLERSLLIEKEDLYRAARRLYSTRNRIVHRGEVAEQDDATLNIDAAGARTGVQTSLEVCYWFGMSERYIVPRERVELRQSEEYPSS